MPNPRKKLAGKKYGWLTVIRVAPPDRHGNTQWHCNCDCGVTTIARYHHLSTGRTKSCGCQQGRTRDEALTDDNFWGT